MALSIYDSYTDWSQNPTSEKKFMLMKKFQAEVSGSLAYVGKHRMDRPSLDDDEQPQLSKRAPTVQVAPTSAHGSMVATPLKGL